MDGLVSVEVELLLLLLLDGTVEVSVAAVVLLKREVDVSRLVRLFKNLGRLVKDKKLASNFLPRRDC